MRRGVCHRMRADYDFNPRIPYGMRLHLVHVGAGRADFNPRIPYGMRRILLSGHGNLIGISIHASRMGCDRCCRRRGPRCRRFQSTHPVWDATPFIYENEWCFTYFNPRIPYGMRPVPADQGSTTARFQSTHPVWDATIPFRVRCARLIFQSTHPVWDATRF